MKKSQMEMMGLALIVVLLVLGLLFVVRFVLTKPQDSSVREEYVTSELSSNFLNAMLETNSPDCSGVSFSNLYIDCANYFPDGRIQCNTDLGTVNSCKYIETETRFLLDKTLSVWKIKYVLIATKSASNDPSAQSDWLFPAISNDPDVHEICKGNRKPKIQPLPTDGQPINIWLYICQ